MRATTPTPKAPAGDFLENHWGISYTMDVLCDLNRDAVRVGQNLLHFRAAPGTI
jgi:hypothetical protein